MIPLPQPIAAAYDGAMSVACANCGAAPGRYCTKPTGQLRRVPCLVRCRAITPDRGSLDPGADPMRANESQPPMLASLTTSSENATPAAPATQVANGYHHPGEPRHRREDD